MAPDDEELKVSVDASHFHHLEIATKSLVFKKDGNAIVVTRNIKKEFDWELLGVANDDEKEMQE